MNEKKSYCHFPKKKSNTILMLLMMNAKKSIKGNMAITSGYFLLLLK